MTGLEDRNDDNLANMICGIYCENNPFIKIENIKEEILSRLKGGALWEYSLAKTLVKYGNNGRKIGNSKKIGERNEK